MKKGKAVRCTRSDQIKRCIALCEFSDMSADYCPYGVPRIIRIREAERNAMATKLETMA